MVPLHLNASKRILWSRWLTRTSMNFIGSGVVFNVPQFFKEMQELADKGLQVDDRIFVSDRVHIDLQLHIAADGLEEKELGG